MFYIEGSIIRRDEEPTHWPTVAENLRKALEFLGGGKRWIKGDYVRNEFDGFPLNTKKPIRRITLKAAQACSIGAVGVVKGQSDLAAMAFVASSQEVALLRSIAMEQYPERFKTIPEQDPTIAQFNDHGDTTWEDVERVFEKAIARAEEMI